MVKDADQESRQRLDRFVATGVTEDGPTSEAFAEDLAFMQSQMSADRKADDVTVAPERAILVAVGDDTAVEKLGGSEPVASDPDAARALLMNMGSSRDML